MGYGTRGNHDCRNDGGKRSSDSPELRIVLRSITRIAWAKMLLRVVSPLCFRGNQCSYSSPLLTQTGHRWADNVFKTPDTLSWSSDSVSKDLFRVYRRRDDSILFSSLSSCSIGGYSRDSASFAIFKMSTPWAVALLDLRTCKFPSRDKTSRHCPLLMPPVLSEVGGRGVLQRTNGVVECLETSPKRLKCVVSRHFSKTIQDGC
jgi:hypothetical protein